MLPDCECKGRAFLHSLQDFHEKKCEKNSFAPILLLHGITKSAVKLDFSLHPLPIVFSPKPPFFAQFGRFGGKIHLLRSISFFSALDFLAQNLILRRKNQFDEEFSDQNTRNSTFAGEEKEKVGVFLSLPHSTQKIQADFLSKLLHFSRLPPLFYLKPPYPVQTPIQSYAQDTRLRVYTRSRTHRICHFCLHPSPHPTTNCISVA